MIRIRKIDSLESPELAPYRTLRRQEDHRRQGFFVAEGEKVVRRLLESHLGVLSVLLPEKWLGEYEPLIRSRPEDIQVFVAEKEELEQLTGFTMYQGLLAMALVPPEPDLETVLEKSPRPHLFVAIDGLSNAENVGVLVRNCAAFGAHALLVGRNCASPYLRRAVRNSMGAIFRQPVLESLSLEPALRALRARGIRCIAAHPHPGSRPVAQTDFSVDCCVVFGSEGFGIPAEIIATCDETAAIPMAPGVDSLNVAGAAAVLLYEVQRQRAASHS